ncbi:MAG: class I SAM-dependent methyltransferase [Pirellulales bacterium]|nr:class I SAM-dependent methyltransferase [Pirellulales bacterium]
MASKQSIKKPRTPRGPARRRNVLIKNAKGPQRKKVFNRLVENRLIEKVDYEEYRDAVRDVYDGKQGAFLLACSMLSLHAPLGERIFSTRRFDLSRRKRILDVGSGAGQIAKHLTRHADANASITCFDISPGMVRRAVRRIKSNRPNYLVADLTQLPFADNTFDCVTCGYVLEHLPDPEVGLRELHRVMQPGGSMLLLTTEDNFGGAWTSRLWRCRTYNRREIRDLCKSLGFEWAQEIWFTRVHKIFRAGGICVELRK